jgi:group II intron reverse transcriptase/maturase
VADGLALLLKPGNAGGGKEPWFEEDAGRSAGQEIGVNLQTPESVQKLQNALHAKAKGAPDYRFYALYDKVYRSDVLNFAYRMARSNGGAPGVDGQDFTAIEAYGVERWLGELTQALKENTYRAQAVRRVYIPKADGKQRPLGIPTVRDRVVQTAAVLILTPIFEADLDANQYAYRPGRNAHDAVRHVHRLLNMGYTEVVDADLSDYFGSVPHAELMRCLARRIVDRQLLALIKQWLVMPVDEDDGCGGTKRSTVAKDDKRGTPQGAPISPLLSNLYLRRFMLGWKTLGYERKLRARIVSYADDFVILCRGSASSAAMAMRRMMQTLKLTVNEAKTHVRRLPHERFDFLGYTFGRFYSAKTGRAFIGARPSAKSVRKVSRTIHELTSRRWLLLDERDRVERLNRVLTGWANYFCLGPVSSAYVALDRHASHRLRRWLCLKHKAKARSAQRFSHEFLYHQLGLVRLAVTTRNFPWAHA